MSTDPGLSSSGPVRRAGRLPDRPEHHFVSIAGRRIASYTSRTTTGHHFYLLNGGNAVNFLHGASVGPFIFLVQSEILAAVCLLARGGLKAAMHEVPAEDRAAIAATWLRYYNR